MVSCNVEVGDYTWTIALDNALQTRILHYISDILLYKVHNNSSLQTLTIKICHFCFYNLVENKTNFVLKCPLYNFIRDKIPSTV